jgi:hypothetical protein
MRTAKSCGPDAATLASSSSEASFSGATVARKPVHRGEREISRKPSRRESRVRAAPAVSCANMHKKRTRAYRFSGNTPAFPAQWFYGLLRALPGERAFLPPSPPGSLLPRNLTPASGRQDHTTSPSASVPFVNGTSASTASQPAFVTIATRPSFG